MYIKKDQWEIIMARQLILKNYIDDIIELIEQGTSEKNISQILGFSHNNLTRWKERGRKALKKPKDDLDNNDELCIELFQAVIQSRKVLTNGYMMKIKEDPSWQSAAWWLERNYPKAFARRVEFDPEELEKWLNRNFSESVVNLILSLMENGDEDFTKVQEYLEQHLSELYGSPDGSTGASALEGPVEAIPSRESTMAPEQKHAELATEGTDN